MYRHVGTNPNARGRLAKPSGEVIKSTGGKFKLLSAFIIWEESPSVALKFSTESLASEFTKFGSASNSLKRHLMPKLARNFAFSEATKTEGFPQ